MIEYSHNLINWLICQFSIVALTMIIVRRKKVMLVLKNFFILFLSVCMAVSFSVFALSHAPSKKNKTRAKMRKWSTIIIIATTMIATLYISQPILACSLVISFILLHIAFSQIIKTL